MTDPWGIDDGYWDVDGVWHETSPDTAAALRSAMGAGERVPDDGPPAGRLVWVVRAGAAEPLLGPCELALEDGGEVRVEGALPPDLPIGYHDLRPLDGGPATRLIVTPGRCHRREDLRAWLLTVQLPACRSTASWGIGDLGDLRTIGAWAAARGAGMVGASPLHAPVPLDRVEPSPYFPSSRRWSTPLALRIEDVPGAAGDVTVEGLAERARRLNAAPLVDRDAVWDLKRRALEHLWVTLGPDLRFERWRAELGDDLETYARFCALAEHHGTGWSAWPAQYRHPAGAGVASFAAAHAERVAFWAWAQFLVDEQLRRAEEPLPLLTDLAIGVDPDGADAWAMQDLLATGVRVGAPPDEFNRAGQDWGLPPFVPHALRDAAYEPVASLWSAAMGLGGGLRIDHVMGLFRLYWIPPGGGPADGAYVRYRGDEMLAVLAIESVRSGAVVVGENLGTVEDEVRHALGEAGVLSYRLAWFEGEPPEHYPAQALAAVTTHDLPTIAGVWSGDDAADQRAAGVEPDEGALERLRGKLMALTGLPPDSPVEDVIVALHARLATAPSELVAATFEDALALRQRPNLPGTTDERPNWSLALPVPLGEALADPLVSRVVEALRR
ncbi:MAG: 4-alpha-glucanotransferase [Acidimicrobiales bacterium]